MAIFYNHLLTLGLAALVLLLFLGIYRWASIRLADIGGRGSGDHAARGAEGEGNSRSILGMLKHLPREFLPELKEAFSRNNQACRELVRGALTKKVIVNVLLDLVLAGLISLFMANFCGSKEGGLDLYMSTFIPLLGVMLLIFWVAETLGANRILAFCAALLIFVGMCLQVLLRLPAESATAASELVIFAVISSVFGLLMLPVIRLVCCQMRRDHALLLLHLALVFVYLLLAVFGKTINGTRAWIVVGGFSFQMTELTKVLTCAIFALQFTNENVYVRDRSRRRRASGRQADIHQLRNNRRLWDALITLGINGVMLLAFNELGTLCVLGVVFFVMGMIYLGSVKRLVAIVVMCCMLAAMILGVCYLCYGIRHPAPSKEPTETTAPAETVEPTETTAPAETTAPSGTEPAEGAEQSREEPVSLRDRIINLGEKIYKKFKIRIDLLFFPENVDPYNEGYQTMKARKAMLLAGWLGSEYEVSIPVVSSDFIFAYLIMKMGMLFGLTALTLLLVMLCLGGLNCLRNGRTVEAAVGLSFLLGITLQSLLAAASATNQFIMIGLPFAFVAEGGTASVMNYTMLLFILFVTRRGVDHSQRRAVRSGEYLRRKEG